MINSGKLYGPARIQVRPEVSCSLESTDTYVRDHARSTVDSLSPVFSFVQESLADGQDLVDSGRSVTQLLSAFAAKKTVQPKQLNLAFKHFEAGCRGLRNTPPAIGAAVDTLVQRLRYEVFYVANYLASR